MIVTRSDSHDLALPLRELDDLVERYESISGGGNRIGGKMCAYLGGRVQCKWLWNLAQTDQGRHRGRPR